MNAEQTDEQIIDSLGMHDAAVKLARRQGYVWEGGSWTKKNRASPAIDTEAAVLSLLGEALGSAQLSVAQAVADSPKGAPALAADLSRVLFQIGNTSEYLGLRNLTDSHRMRVALAIVREYPDFDGGGPLPEMIDQVLTGSPSPMIEKLYESSGASLRSHLKDLAAVGWMQIINNPQDPLLSWGPAEQLPRSKPAILEAGPWKAGVTSHENSQTFVESDDFEHDVRLYVDGDFEDKEQRLEYAKEIARRLNMSSATLNKSST